MTAEGPAGSGASRGVRFAMAKFRPTTLPATLIARSVLHDRLDGGARKRLTVVVGSAGAGKSVLLSSWAAARPADVTSWLSCDDGDADRVRFWAGFIEAPRVIAPGFGADAADLLAMDGAMTADVTASIANDASKLPPGSAIIVDDFHVAAAAARDMTDLVERWPARTAQLVLASRSDPAIRLHRLRMASELCELRDRDLYFSLTESRDLLGKFGVSVSAGELALLHRGSEGWAAALQMAALSLRGGSDPARVVRALEGRPGLAEYFLSEVLEQQPAEVAQFMLDSSVLGELTAGVCVAVTGRQDAAVLLSRLDAASLFVVPLDDERTSFRYHHLVRRVLQAELRARDRPRERMLHLRAGEWFEAAGEARRAARHFLAARQADRALALIQDRVVPEFLRDPALPAAPDLSTLAPAVLADAPDRLLAVAADLLTWGDTARGGKYLDLFEGTMPLAQAEPRLAARFTALRSFHYGVTGHLGKAVQTALTARAMQKRANLTDEWNTAVPLVLLRVYAMLEDFPAVEREAATALGMPELTEPARQVTVPGARALAWFAAGHLAQAAGVAAAAEGQAQRLGFGQHFFVVDSLRVLAGLALERRDLGTAERLTERVLSITERRRPVFEFLALLDRAAIWAAGGQVREALGTVDAARRVLAGTRSVLLARADELEALLRLSLGDLQTPAALASGLPTARRGLILARIALAVGDHRVVQEPVSPPAGLTPRQTLEHQTLQAAAAIERGDPATDSILGAALHTARDHGFLSTVITTAPQVTSYLIEHSNQLRPDPFLAQLIAAALDARAATAAPAAPTRELPQPLTAAELRVLKLLPTSTYLQMAATLDVSRNTVKTHLRSVYQKLGVTSRPQALQRAVDLRLL